VLLANTALVDRVDLATPLSPSSQPATGLSALAPAQRAGAQRLCALAQSGGRRAGRACPLCPAISDINLFRYCEGVIDLDAEIPDSAFDLGMPEQELDSPEIARPSIDQGGLGAKQRMRAK
jgi:hypothetical protein